jgi:hypothetical protein
VGHTYTNADLTTLTGSTPSVETIATTSNQLDATGGNIIRTYGYDAAGNTTSYTGETYTFNQRGRMRRGSSCSSFRTD